MVVLVAVSAIALHYEFQHSYWQARLIAPYAQSLTYARVDGRSRRVVYPESGPFNERLGYVRLPELLDLLEDRGLQVTRSTRFSSTLLQYTRQGFNPPYDEKDQAGLAIRDCSTREIFRFNYPQRVYARFEDIPPTILNALLFIEDRELLNTEQPYYNPVVNWDRLAKAVVLKAGEWVNLDVPSIGGSTLATQIEKYRHSEDGVTGSVMDKLDQMVSATVRVYQNGPETRAARQAIALHYLNTVPLSAAPGYGEVNSLGDGLHVWFGADFDEVNTLLGMPAADGEVLRRQARALRQIVALMVAHRRPSEYLHENREGLSHLTDSYIRLLARTKLIEAKLAHEALDQATIFRDFRVSPVVRPAETNKGINMVRTRLTSLLGASLYDLDRMDLTVDASLDYALQEQVSTYLRDLADEANASAKGLVGEYLLKPGQAAQMGYSFTLLEVTPDGNRVRVQTDNTRNPFDINEGSKLELGSTAKLRVLTSYLEIIAELHARYSGGASEMLRERYRSADDPLSRWVLERLLEQPDIALSDLLEAALERPYSANPRERFFTGGGEHVFSNFRREDDHRMATARDSFRDSLNLPFVRMLREIISYLSRQLWEEIDSIRSDDRNPARQALLASFIDRESRQFLSRFWRKYANLPREDRLETFLLSIRPTETRLAAIHRSVFPRADRAAFDTFMQAQLPGATLGPKRLENLYQTYGPGRFDLQDQGYIARVHPLELWVLAYLEEHPEASQADAVRDSEEARKQVYRWLFTTRSKNARDQRVRIALEVEAFSELNRRWRRLGYPFDHLVPSYATALGSSGDRPAALAELMGIIVNDGRRQATRRLEHLHFAADTPYETEVRFPAQKGQPVMAPEVARALQGVLSLVTQEGTARRLRGAFVRDDGQPLLTGGKTGTGDNRLVQVVAGTRLKGKALSRTATFVFRLGDQHFGTLTAFVLGEDSSQFRFTSALPVQTLKGLAPLLSPYIQGKAGCGR